jgi:hypothetical protein
VSDLLDLARAGNQVDLVRALEFETACVHCVGQGGRQLTESEKLIDEALWYAKHGELDEAAYRLSMVDDDEENDGEDCE